MKNWNRLPRFLLVLTLLIGLCAGLFASKMQKAKAAADRLDIVISEFRFVGPQGANDEFIELYNPTNNPINMAALTLWGSNGTGTTISERSITGTLPSLQPGQYYLLVNSAASTGLLTLADATYTPEFTEDGGVALIRGTLFDDPIVDAVGLSAGSYYLEGTPLAPLSGSADQSYERKTGGNAGNCKDTDNNAADFVWNKTTSNPQNSSSPPLRCIVVTDVSSTTPDGVYTSGAVINIEVMFSTAVNVTGSPTLLMETGLIDQKAIYVSGSGTNTLTFRYTVMSGDSSSLLDYVSANALVLNGGSIIGAVGDATLILPAPGAPSSLGANNNIRIDIAGPPSIISFKRQDPLTTPTNANSLTFRATFSEAVTGVDVGAFVTNGFILPPSSVIQVSGSEYDVIISDPSLATSYNGVVGLDFNAPTIFDVAGNPLPATEPSIDETYTVDYIPPDVTIEQALGQVDPAPGSPVNFTVVFSEVINVNTFTPSDITQATPPPTGALGITWSIVDSGDHKTFTLSSISSGNGILNPTILAGRVKDLAGNDNTASTSIDNSVDVQDFTPPTVTVNQAATQSDPAGALPVKFTVVFSEPIITSIFTTSDITQTGTATGITWSITDSGDHKTFTLSATAVSGAGTLIPSIAANRVTDPAGNNNTASTSTDNSVTYTLVTTVVRSVIINEVAWAGTTSSLPNDEWIELYNPGSNAINISGWNLKSAGTTPHINIILNGAIPAGGYFLLERDDDSTVNDIIADQIYTGALDDTGEALTLYDPLNKVIDTANGNGGAWPKGSSVTFGTMERVGTSAESDSTWSTNTGIKRNGLNANGGNILGTPKNRNTVVPTAVFVPTSVRKPTRTPTPGPPTARPAGKPYINEFLPRPGFDWNNDGKVNVFDEFIELKNVGNADLNLTGWQLDDGADHPGVVTSAPYTIANVILKPGQYAVFYGLQTNISLSDGGDSVRLFDATGKLVDVIDYAIAKVEDRSVCRVPDGNGFGSWFSDCIPSPNQTNTREGQVPSSPSGALNQTFVCTLPDTLPADFLFAECRGYGANIWDSYYWDKPGWQGDQIIPTGTSKWESFVE